MTTPMLVGLSARYEPRWRDVPRLGWVAARAYLPPGLPGVVAASVAGCSLVLTLPIVTTMRARGSIAALDRRAMVEITLVGRHRRVSTSLVAGGSLLAVFVVITVPAFVVAVLALRITGTSGAAIAAGSAVVAVPSVVAVLTVNATAVIRAWPPLRRTIQALQRESPGAPIWRVGYLAAWPQRHGHARELLTGLLRDCRAGGYVVCVPRDAEVEQWYLRLGLRRHPDGGALYLDLASRPDSPPT